MNNAVAIGVLLAMYDMVCMGTEFSGVLHLYVYRFLQLYIIFWVKKGTIADVFCSLRPKAYIRMHLDFFFGSQLFDTPFNLSFVCFLTGRCTTIDLFLTIIYVGFLRICVISFQSGNNLLQEVILSFIV
ncbi:hypothetical protein OIU77_007228 [Salix suchowensis]|uniref:Uncharacterized protein n=1 Tax=Salix suchowensis TaxID=1278906 RepID=A0ABQ9AGP7_9ROSI|nr:hypothetical protein OIU77_007228 [Salix suchowensis]